MRLVLNSWKLGIYPTLLTSFCFSKNFLPAKISLENCEVNSLKLGQYNSILLIRKSRRTDLLGTLVANIEGAIFD